MPTVSIVQRILPHYRLAFFDRLHQALGTEGVQLQLWYGQEQEGARPATVEVEGAWARRIKNHYLPRSTSRAPAVWQPCLPELFAADLVICEHAARLLINYPLALLSKFGRPRLAFWGHGVNLQADSRDDLLATIRTRLMQRAHWWFAYTALSARALTHLGYPLGRITVVNNAIDSRALGQAIASTSPEDRAALRVVLGLPDRGVAIFCGRLVPEKRLDLLRAACEIVYRQRPHFRVIVVGDGPDEPMVQRMAEECGWLRFVGAKFGQELAAYLAVSDFMLMPGLVGLVIVDSFAAGVPLVTTDHPGHSPEIEYLRNGDNAVMTPMDKDSIASAILALLDSPDKLLQLRAGCAISAREYTLENMVQRFSSGVLQALGH